MLLRTSFALLTYFTLPISSSQCWLRFTTVLSKKRLVLVKTRIMPQNVNQPICTCIFLFEVWIKIYNIDHYPCTGPVVYFFLAAEAPLKAISASDPGHRHSFRVPRYGLSIFETLAGHINSASVGSRSPSKRKPIVFTSVWLFFIQYTFVVLNTASKCLTNVYLRSFILKFSKICRG